MMITIMVNILMEHIINHDHQSGNILGQYIGRGLIMIDGGQYMVNIWLTMVNVLLNVLPSMANMWWMCG